MNSLYLQGVHLILCFYEDFFTSVSVCVHNGRSNTNAAAELAEFKNHNIYRKKHNI